MIRLVPTLALILFLATGSGANEFEVPPLRSAVTDRAGILSAATKDRLERALQHLQRVGGTQLAVLTVPNLGGLTIEQASIQVADSWKLGSAKADNGVLLLVAQIERRIRIEVGQGLEGVLTDAYSKRIIDESVTPLFREGDMNGGVVMGVYQIARVTNPDIDLTTQLEGHLRSPRGREPRGGSPAQLILYGMMMMLIFSMRTGILPLLLMGSATGRHRGGSMGGFGGGGFSGGGGGFSGGGASGGW